MVTYKPHSSYKTFQFYERFQVYSNDSVRMNALSVEPTAISSQPGDIVYTITKDELNINATEENVTVIDLVKKLFRQNQTNNTQLNDADKVMVLYYWLTNQNIKYNTYKLTNDFEMVNYQLQKLKDKKNSYASFFALLCYYAKIPCVIVKGHVKGGAYDIDKSLSDDLIREWNAVLVDKKWQLVDSFWGRVYSGRTLSQEPFYLFPGPEHLRYTHCPINHKWQLLQEPMTTEQFMKQPVLKHHFFNMKMEVLSTNDCGEIRCETGEQEIVFRLKSSTYYKQHFLCATSRRNENNIWEFERLPQDDVQLDFIQTKTNVGVEEEEENIETLFDDDDDDSVVNETAGGNVANNNKIIETLKSEKTQSWSVNQPQPQNETDTEETEPYLYIKIRFPEKGFYKLEIIGRQNKFTDYDWVAIYYVNVSWVPDWKVYFPKEPIEGWGPNQYLRKCGLEAITHTNGEIKCYIPRWLQIKFKILRKAVTKDIRLRYELKRTDDNEPDNTDETNGNDETDGNERDVSEQFTMQADKETFKPNKDLVINTKVLIKTKGEYVICISATLNETDKGEVIYYRIAAERDPREIEEEKAKEALGILNKAIDLEDINELENALKTTNATKAHTLVLERYYYASKLRRRLINLRKALKRIAHIDNRLIATIRGYPNPNQEIISVMRATFILLGEPLKHLQKWETIRPMLKTIGSDSLKQRLDKIDKKAIPREDVLKARAALGEENTLGALKQSEDVAAMMLWMESVFIIHNIDIQQ